MSPPYSKLRDVPFTTVKVESDFWTPKIETIQNVTVPDLLEQAKWYIQNFEIVGGTSDKNFVWGLADDSSLYKILEGGIYSMATQENPELLAKIDDIIDKIASAQDDNGYINTAYSLPLDDPRAKSVSQKVIDQFGFGLKDRWVSSPENWKEDPKWQMGLGQFYCPGHMMESAVAHYRLTGRTNYLDIAIKMADHICNTFPIDQPILYRDHPQLGIGLMKLYEVVPEPRYLKMAKHYIEDGKHSRTPDEGNGESHKPLLEQRKAYGHCVRTGYIYSAATDLCRYTGDPAMRETIDSLWHSIVDSRFFVHGGVGDGTHHEQHGEDFHLPTETNYCECCANIAQGQWNHRLNLLTADAKHADIVEWEMYNAALSGISLNGTEYMYQNRLNFRSSSNNHQGTMRRRYLFCCPSKLPTFVAGIGRWIYAIDDQSIYVNQYVASTATIDHPLGKIAIVQKNHYPWDGKLQLVLQNPKPVEMTVALRIPGWVYKDGPLPTELYRFAKPQKGLKDVKLRIGGQPLELPELQNGYIRLTRKFEEGTTIELELPMPARRIYADRRAEDLRGRVALSRGPVLFCLEQPDNPDGRVLNCALPKDQAIASDYQPKLLDGVVTLHTKGLADGKKLIPLTAIPYYAWENRGVEDMATWIIEDTAICTEPPKPDPTNLASQAKIMLSRGLAEGSLNSVEALHDGIVPDRSGDKKTSRMTWWPQKTGTAWVDYLFKEPINAEEVRVYWFQDHPNGGCKLPAKWRLLYQTDQGAWKPVENSSKYSLDLDRYNSLKFKRISTKGLRLEVQMQEGFSAGVYEWRVEPVSYINEG